MSEGRDKPIVAMNRLTGNLIWYDHFDGTIPPPPPPPPPREPDQPMGARPIEWFDAAMWLGIIIGICFGAALVEMVDILVPR